MDCQVHTSGGYAREPFGRRFATPRRFPAREPQGSRKGGACRGTQAPTRNRSGHRFAMPRGSPPSLLDFWNPMYCSRLTSFK